MAYAFVTGASRGIGKAAAVHLARSGHDVALSARTIEEGERREHSPTVHRSNTDPYPGSLTTTAKLVEAAGRKALIVPADLTDRSSVIVAAETVLAEWGNVDVLVNDGRYVGPGTKDPFTDTPIELLDASLQANLMSPLVLSKAFLPGMPRRGSGVIANITSTAGFRDPPAGAPASWALEYGISKGGFHRIAGVFNAEMRDRGIRAYNLIPGPVAYEHLPEDIDEFGRDEVGRDVASLAPPDVVGAVVAWLATSPDAAEAEVAADGRVIRCQDVCKSLELLAGWPT